jgi:hypothetical protein
MDKKIDGELNLTLATRTAQLLFGGQITDLSFGGKTVSLYLNDCNLEFSYDNSNLAGKVLIDLESKLLGLYDVVAAGMPNPITFDVRYDHMRSAKLAFKIGQFDPKG